MKSEKVIYRTKMYYLWFAGNKAIIASKLEDVGIKGYVLRFEEYMEVDKLDDIRDEKINKLLKCGR
jgi:hypothetical protein